MVVLSVTTTSKRSRLFILSCVFVVVPRNVKRSPIASVVSWPLLECLSLIFQFINQTAKKIKHKRKKVKMSILKYYKVDSDGKIKRLRRECPTAECGAGVFVRASRLALCQYLMKLRRWLSTQTASTVVGVVSRTPSSPARNHP
jgi:ribosomal protein S27AE